MAIKKVTAIIDEQQLVVVEKALETRGVTGFSIHPVLGRGEYCNTYSKNHLFKHVQIEVYTSENHATKIARLIAGTADVGADGEGLVSIHNVDTLLWINSQKTALEEEFNYFEVSDG